MIRALLTGQLYGPPQARTSKSGSTFATAKVKADATDVPALADGRFVTVLRDTQRRPQGKRFQMVDGKPTKLEVKHPGDYEARSVYVPDLTALAQLVAGFGPDDVLILGCVEAAGLEPYRIIPAKRLARQLGLPRDARPAGVHTIGGIQYAARLKENFSPCRYAFVDRDTAATPDEINALSGPDFVALLNKAWPGFAAAEKVEFPSSSGRVAWPDGTPALAAGVSSHIYFELADDAWRNWDDLRLRLEVSSSAAGLCFETQSKAGATLRRWPWDTSVFSTCREVFESAPAIEGAGLIVLPRQWNHTPGGQCPLPPARTPVADAAFERATGAKISSGRAVAVDQSGAMTLATQIETERYGVVTVADFIDRRLDRTRCQTWNRDSTSWNGILGWTKTGNVFYHDNGLRRTFFLSETDASSPEPAAPIAADWKDLAAALAQLREAQPAQCRPVARKILSKYAPQSPRKRRFTDLASAVVDALPAGCNPALARQLTTFAGWLERQARARAVASTTINRAQLLAAGVEVRTVADLSGVAVMVAANPAPLYLVKAPIASGKTQLVLKPLAQLPGCVVGITNRVSLVADLCNPANLDLDNYQQVKMGDIECTNRLGVCLPSIVNPKFNDVLSRADSVLIDEINGAMRELHTTSGILKKSGPDAMRRLAALLNQARVAVGVDADLSTLDVLTLRAAIQRPIVVIEMTAQRPGLTVIHDDADKVKAAILEAVANGEKVRVACDSSRTAIEMAALLRDANPDKRIVCVQSRQGDSTAGDPDVLKLLADINAGLVGIDCLVHSPTVESGVSITTPHFTRTFGLFGGRSVAPAGFIQMLLRDRTATTFELGFAGHCRQWLDTEPLAILANLEATHRRTVELVGESGAVAGLVKVEPATAFDESVCRYRAARHVDLNDAGQNLLLLLESRGFEVRRGLGFAAISAEEKLSARLLADAEYQAAVMESTPITGEQRTAYEGKYQLSPMESAEVERYDAAGAVGVAPDDLTTDDLRLYEHGRLVGWNRRWDLLNAAPLAGVAADVSDADFVPALGLRRHELALGEAYRTLWEVAGLDWRTGEGTITADSALEAWRNLHDSPSRAVLETAGLCRLDRAPAYPVRWLGDALKKFGIGLEEHGRDERCYTLASGLQKKKDGLTVKAPGLEAMRRCAQMRQERIKDISPASAQRAPSTISARPGSARTKPSAGRWR